MYWVRPSAVTMGMGGPGIRRLCRRLPKKLSNDVRKFVTPLRSSAENERVGVMARLRYSTHQNRRCATSFCTTPQHTLFLDFISRAPTLTVFKTP